MTSRTPSMARKILTEGNSLSNETVELPATSQAKNPTSSPIPNPLWPFILYHFGPVNLFAPRHALDKASNPLFTRSRIRTFNRRLDSTPPRFHRLLQDCRRGVNDRSRASRPILHDHRKDPTRYCRQKRKRACSSNFATERVTTMQTLFWRFIDWSPRRLPLCSQVSTLCTDSPETIGPTVNALARLASSPIPWIHIFPVHIGLL